MMTDFEDKGAAAPLSVGARIEIMLIGGLMCISYFGMARTVWSWLATLFS